MGIVMLALSLIACQRGPKKTAKTTEQASQENIDETSMEGNGEEVSEKGTADLGPNFNPVGSEVAYYSYVSENPPVARIFISNLDGSNTRQVSHLDSIGFHVEPKWSRDGKKIVYTSFLEVGSRMMVVDADGENPTELATVSDDGFHMFTSWDLSGDGYFFFHWPKEEFTPDAYYAYYAKDGKVERLTENGKTNRPQITEDGVLYINRVESETPYVATKQLYDMENKKIIKDIPELEGEFIVGKHTVKSVENEDSTTFVLEDLQGNDLKELGTVPYKKIMFTTIDKNLEYVAYNTDFADGAEIHLLKIATGEIIKVTKN
ncbi:hypothetical protein SAMN04488116_3132 [Flagellimonas flava]|uniref:WD40-like Beta Propeller Repeat n=2 Tax=Flagellimonas flava TaxID=570519 RepID=A0A1M5P8E8_9FLAO|nr:hypothetical protein SAMN04488116_3132 [Allomuricauda flava]